MGIINPGTGLSRCTVWGVEELPDIAQSMPGGKKTLRVRQRESEEIWCLLGSLLIQTTVLGIPSLLHTKTAHHATPCLQLSGIYVILKSFLIRKYYFNDNREIHEICSKPGEQRSSHSIIYRCLCMDIWMVHLLFCHMVHEKEKPSINEGHPFSLLEPKLHSLPSALSCLSSPQNVESPKWSVS